MAKSLLALASSSAMALALSSPAFAQDSAATAPSAQGISDIVVTAEKRPSVVQKTAMAISVLTAKELTKNGVASLSDLSSIAPSVSFALNNAATVVTIRGVSSRDATEVGDPAVAVSIDNFTLQRAIGLNAAVFDLDRVEVLRGPQGTLLGRNATGGAINLVTAKPTDKLAAYIGGEVGDYGLYSTKAMLNVPVNDWLKLRAAFQTRDHNGYRNNGPAVSGDDEHSRSARLRALITPTSRLTLLLTGEYNENHSAYPAINGIPLQYYTAANVPAGFIVGDINYSAPAARGNGSSFAYAPGGFLRYKIYSVRAEADYDLGFGTLTYQGGYRHLITSRAGILGGAYGSSTQNWSFNTTEDLPSWNHEIRLSSNGNGRFKWQFGGFYFQEKNNENNLFLDFPGSPGLYGPSALLQRFYYPDITARAKAAFGQASYEIVPGLRVEAGARYSTDYKYRTSIVTSTDLGVYASTKCYVTSSCVYSTATAPQLATSSKTTYHAAVNYQVTPRNLLYAKYDTGYKAGGFSTVEYFPESVKAYEIGSKNRFFDNKLQVNLDAYYYDYSNQQVTQTTINPSSGGIANLVLNAGKSHYKGVEADVIYQPSPADRFNIYVGYNHARYADFATSASGELLRLAQSQGRAVAVTSSTGAVSYNIQLAGKTPPQSPDWSINAGYEHNFAAFGGKLTPRVQTHYESKSYFSFYNLGLDEQVGYTKTDFMVTFTPASERYTLTAYVRNLEDRLILANVQSPPSTTFGTYREQYQAPRTFGGSFTYNW